ncbi:MAG: hypothetical protein OXF79_05485 [Chloroflexi bacterium]|nr:hypothetical protein [Chloroflexota bacterium]
MDDVAGKARTYPEPLPANARRIPIPAAALSQWLADIDDIVELKVTLRALALLAEEPRRRSVPPSIALEDLLDDPVLAEAELSGLENHALSGLAAAVVRGTLAAIRDAGAMRVLLNDGDCRTYLETAGLKELAAADLAGQADADAPEPHSGLPRTGEPRANIFELYEQHIGPYGHSIAEQLRAAEEEYPPEWIADAIAIAAERNVRSWRFIDAVLRRKKQERQAQSEAGITDRSRDISHEHGKPGNDTAPDSRSGYLDSYRRRHGRLPWEPAEPDRG